MVHAGFELLSTTHSPDLSSERGALVLVLEVADLMDDALPTHVARVSCDPMYANPIERIEVVTAIDPERRHLLCRFIYSRACAEWIRDELIRAVDDAKEACCDVD